MFQQDRSATDAMQVDHCLVTAWRKATKHRRSPKNLLQVKQPKFHLRFPSQRYQMENTVGRTSNRRNGRGRILERSASEDIAGTDLLFQQVANELAGCSAFLLLCIINGRDRTALRRHQSDCLQSNSPGVERRGNATAPRSGTGMTTNLVGFSLFDSPYGSGRL